MEIENRVLIIANSELADLNFESIDFKNVDSVEIYFNDIENVPIRLQIRKNGQNNACTNDNIVVCGGIQIGNLDGAQIPRDVRFGSRLTLLGEDMDVDWGYYDEKEKIRRRSYTFDSNRWAKAFAEAHNIVMTELNGLLEMIRFRREALENAFK
jgi:hypothetical protein